jgi:hypothetical protein
VDESGRSVVYSERLSECLPGWTQEELRKIQDMFAEPVLEPGTSWIRGGGVNHYAITFDKNKQENGEILLISLKQAPYGKFIS